MASAGLPQIVPVLDVMRGRVVRAVRGDRQTYRPVHSMLVAGHEPVALACALVAASRSPQRRALLYVADLDAIQGGAAQVHVIATLMAALPGVELWIDAGFADAGSVRRLAAALPAGALGWRPVYGSETLGGPAALDDIVTDPAAILSLDHRGRPLDPAGCWQQPGRWPSTVIVMTLERVGSGGGPDLSTLAALRARAPDRRWFGAGGVRDATDLAAAAVAGAEGWLVASALHDGRLGVDGPGG